MVLLFVLPEYQLLHTGRLTAKLKSPRIDIDRYFHLSSRGRDTGSKLVRKWIKMLSSDMAQRAKVDLIIGLRGRGQ